MNEPFYLTQEKIDSLTDAEIYNKYFRRYDKEADEYEEIKRMNDLHEQRETSQKHDEYVATCLSFGFTEEQAEVEWQKWLREQN